MTRVSLLNKIILLGLAWWMLAYVAYTSQSLDVAVLNSILGIFFLSIFAWDIRRSLKSLAQVRLNQAKPLDTQNIRHQEFLELAQQYNVLLSQLHQRVENLLAERNEHVLIFNSMTEGILAIDDEGKVKYSNPAATRILGLDEANYLGKTIEECVRNPELLAHLEMAVKNEKGLSQELPLYDQEERWLQIQSSPLQHRDQPRQGTITVFSDISHLRRLENLRQEFVANVSHELRTPLTSIHGFAETLIKNPNIPPAQSREFLDIIGRQSRRLGVLIDDLLSLSRIEGTEETEALELKNTPLFDVVNAAAQIFNNPRLKVNCKNNPVLPVNAALLEQACVNLIENAIRYGGADTPIEITLEVKNDTAIVAVKDYGSGIAPEHLPRIFERFYRVDRARSQKLGGTGLGLAIVKHIALAHNGRVEVQSELKKGSTFTLFLPLTQTVQG